MGADHHGGFARAAPADGGDVVGRTYLGAGVQPEFYLHARLLQRRAEAVGEQQIYAGVLNCGVVKRGGFLQIGKIQGDHILVIQRMPARILPAIYRLPCRRGGQIVRDRKHHVHALDGGGIDVIFSRS